MRPSVKPRNRPPAAAIPSNPTMPTARLSASFHRGTPGLRHTREQVDEVIFQGRRALAQVIATAIASIANRRRRVVRHERNPAAERRS
jgi:hypothetical protein